ncbi:hypothetical protein [Segatella bryantii]|uniref:hypothetical protein n=1 Tax=Segatella bryantii TaxID=77095 RepID=UPI00087F9A23|nr:hypothetical protein [Segatella bryantii]SDL60581.1 hypothetical protein SAMN04487899_103164 [Segatella bryantii]
MFPRLFRIIIRQTLGTVRHRSCSRYKLGYKVMAFPREYVSYGVVKLNKFAGYNSVSVYESLYNYKELHGFASSRGMSAVDARWADDIIVVTMDDGSIRRYSDWNRYDTIR